MRDTVAPGDTGAQRAGFAVMSLACISILAAMVGSRASQIHRSSMKNLTLTHYLIFVLYFFAMAFVVSGAVIESGLGLSTNSICKVAVILCLAFYIGSKVIMYIFLVERAHAIRAPYQRRFHDWLWVAGILFIAIGFGAIAVCAFIYLVFDVSRIDGKCRIGLLPFVTLPLLSYDITINVLLTLTFIYLLSPVLLSSSGSFVAFPATRLVKWLGRCCKRPAERGIDLQTTNPRAAKRMEKLLWRTFIGCCLVLIPTVANMVQLAVLKGRERGWICITFCTLDVIWTVCVVHWLTVVSSEFDENSSAESVSEPEFTPEIFRRATAFW